MSLYTFVMYIITGTSMARKMIVRHPLVVVTHIFLNKLAEKDATEFASLKIPPYFPQYISA